MSAARPERLIVSSDFGSQSVFALHEASHDLCEIIWLVDLSTPEMTDLGRLMGRMGTVVDVAGRSEGQVLGELETAGPDGVLNLKDAAAVQVAELAAALGLEFDSPEVARRLSDKFLQRQALQSAGVPTPDFQEIPADPASPDIDLLEREVGFPSVLKPRQGNGSRNAYFVHNRADLGRLLAASGPRHQEPAGMILEGYLPRVGGTVSRFDPIVSVESFVRHGSVHHFAATGRLPFAEPFRETGLVLPSDLSPANRALAEQSAAAAIQALDVRHGCLHTEVKFTPDGPRIIEVNGRIGGGIPQLVQLAGGETSILRFAMQLALGVDDGLALPLHFPRIGWQRTIPPPVFADRIDSIAGLDGLQEIPGIDQVTINRTAGQAVDWRRGLQEYVFQVYGSAADYDELDSQFALVEQAVHITYDQRVAARGRRSTVDTR